MSSYGKVSYMEDNTEVMESVAEDIVSTTTVDSQVEKFDKSYDSQKLQDLYNEYDRITIDEEKIKSVIQVRANAAAVEKASFRSVVLLTTSLIVAVLLAVLCIYNITVINSMNGSIGYLQEEVVNYEADLESVKAIYANLTNSDNVEAELKEMGFSEINSSNMVAINVPEKTIVTELEAETNWFDAVCNFISQIFG